MFRLAAGRRVPVYTHVRSAGRSRAGSSIESVSEVIGAALPLRGARCTSCTSTAIAIAMFWECLSMVEGARARRPPRDHRGVPLYPGMTAINSARFQPRLANQI